LRTAECNQGKRDWSLAPDYSYTSAVAPSIFMTSTCAPGSITPDAHPAAGLVDALENDGMCALERGRTRPHRGRHAQMRARDRPEKADRRSGAGDEDGELDPHRCTERCGDGGRDRRERDGAEEEEARREHLAHGEQHSGDAPRKPAGHD